MYNVSPVILPLPVVPKVINCDVLIAPVNGKVLLNETVFGSQATFDCNDGYMISNSEVHICGADGLWTGSIPTCEGDPSVPFFAKSIIDQVLYV